MKKLAFVLLNLVALCILWGNSHATMIYVGDLDGNVGVYDTDTNTTEPLGNLSEYDTSEMMGLAYDPISDSVLLLNRAYFGNTEAAVFSMDPNSGEVTQLFTTSSGFQGGAVKGGIIYGMNILTDKVEAYSLVTGNPVALSGSVALPYDAQGVGVDPISRQLYISMYYMTFGHL